MGFLVLKYFSSIVLRICLTDHMSAWLFFLSLLWHVSLPLFLFCRPVVEMFKRLLHSQLFSINMHRYCMLPVAKYWQWATRPKHLFQYSGNWRLSFRLKRSNLKTGDNVSVSMGACSICAYISYISIVQSAVKNKPGLHAHKVLFWHSCSLKD